MTIREFLSDRLGKITGQLCCTVTAALFLLATGTSSGVIVLLLLFLLLIFITTQAAEYLKCHRRLSELNALMQGLDQKYLFFECAPPPRTVYEQKLFELMRCSGRAMIGAVSDAQASMQEYREYIESWVHEIKAPIADICLLCEKQKDETARRILEQNRRTENYVDMALFYARSDEVYQDYLIKETTLQDTAEEMLRKNKYYLIENRIQAEVCCPDTVYTDVKWIAFILNQLILNAVKYRRDSGPRIRISTERESRSVLLTVEDNGLGIPPEELPRIFDKGFTGTNGRIRGQSTGMGLYLCRKLCGKLGIRIGAESAEGRGTRIMLEFPVSDYLMKH